jgi:hypothetical protein
MSKKLTKYIISRLSNVIHTVISNFCAGDVNIFLHYIPRAIRRARKCTGARCVSRWSYKLNRN